MNSQQQERPVAAKRHHYDFFEVITLRYADNDANGHVNNAHYYSFFDTAIEGYLRQRKLREILAGSISTPVVASSCRYFHEVAFPGEISLGVRVTRIGTTSITYDIAVFADDNDTASAQGTFTTVTTDRQTKRPIPVPQAFRDQHPQLL